MRRTPRQGPGSQIGVSRVRTPAGHLPPGGETGGRRPRLFYPVILDTTVSDVYFTNPSIWTLVSCIIVSRKNRAYASLLGIRHAFNHKKGNDARLHYMPQCHRLIHGSHPSLAWQSLWRRSRRTYLTYTGACIDECMLPSMLHARPHTTAVKCHC